MSAEDEQRFQSRIKCWICDVFFNVGENRVRDHFHITGKYRDSALGLVILTLKWLKKFL